MADFVLLCPEWSMMARANDGVIAAASPWVLTSATVNFEAQGVRPQGIVVFTGPRSAFRGDVHLMAIDSVSGSAATLRRVGLGLGVGQPPATAADVTQVCFWMPTLQQQIDTATFRIKERFTIDEGRPFRATSWVYAGNEDADPAPRIFRDAVVFETLADLYENAMREQAENGDFARKAKRYRARAEDALARLQVLWGPQGDSAEATSIFSCRLTR